MSYFSHRSELFPSLCSRQSASTWGKDLPLSPYPLGNFCCLGVPIFCDPPLEVLVILKFPVTEALFTVRQVPVTEDMFPVWHENVPNILLVVDVLDPPPGR